MATYKKEKGFAVQTLSTDPIASQVLGGTWASGGNTNTARRFTPGAGTSGPTHNNALIFGGSPSVLDTESYDGSSWTELNNLSANKSSGFGTATAAIGVGAGTAVEQWNGSTWTEINDINSTRNFSGTQGSTTAGLIEGGEAPGGASALSEEYNGTSWSEGNDLNTGRYSLTGAGTQTAGLAMGGYTPPTVQALTEQYDGTSWTEVSDLNTARYDLSGSGSYTEALAYAGNSDPPRQALTEFWNGSSWTEVADLSTARSAGNNAGAGTGSSSAVLATGQTPGSVTTTTTEEFSAPAVFNQLTEGQLYFNSTTNSFKETITDIAGATWASGAAMNTQRAQVASAQASPHSAGQVAGGAYTNVVGNTEQYNGTAWTEVNDLNTANRQNAGSGTQTSAISSGGYNPSWLDVAETWNGSSWTEVAEINQARYQMGAAGVSNTSAMIYSGEGAPSSTQYAKTETWDGSSWTEVNDMNQARYGLAGGGTLTDAIGIGGQEDGAGNPSNKVELWDGTSWTETTEINTSRGYSGAGVSNGSSAIFFAGGTFPNIPGNLKAQTEFWNGSSWTEIADLGTARFGVSGQGTAFDALAAGGGSTTSGGTATEEWTTPLANKTITAS